LKQRLGFRKPGAENEKSEIKKVGQWPTRMRADKARFGGTAGSYGITEGNIAKLRHVARIFHNLSPRAIATDVRQAAPSPRSGKSGSGRREEDRQAR
jgi:hypothetical protein